MRTIRFRSSSMAATRTAASTTLDQPRWCGVGILPTLRRAALETVPGRYYPDTGTVSSPPSQTTRNSGRGTTPSLTSR